MSGVTRSRVRHARTISAASAARSSPLSSAPCSTFRTRGGATCGPRPVDGDPEMAGHPGPEAGENILDRRRIDVDPLDDQHVVGPPEDAEQPSGRRAIGRRVPQLDQVAQGVAHEGRAFPVEEGENHLADRAVGLLHRRAGLRVDQFEQAMVFGDELHAGSALRRLVRRDAVEGVAAAGMIEHFRTEALGQQAADFRQAAARFADAEEIPDAEVVRRPAGAVRRLLDQVAAEGRRRQQGARPGEVEILQNPVGAALDADRDDAGAEMLDAVRQRQAAGEHAERHRLEHDVAEPDAGAPVFPGVHLVDDGDVVRRVGVEGRCAARAGGRDDADDLLARRAGQKFERVAEAVERLRLRGALIRLVHERQAGEILERPDVAGLRAGPGELGAIEGRALEVIAQLPGQPVPLQVPQRVARLGLNRRIPQALPWVSRRHRPWGRRRRARRSRTAARSRRPDRKRRPGHVHRRPGIRP